MGDLEPSFQHLKDKFEGQEEDTVENQVEVYDQEKDSVEGTKVSGKSSTLHT